MGSKSFVAFPNRKTVAFCRKRSTNGRQSDVSGGGDIRDSHHTPDAPVKAGK
jgi:hypothetical protein